jgi:hypothetical protein
VANLRTEPRRPQVLLRCWHGYVATERTLPQLRDRQPLVVAVALILVVRLITFDRGAKGLSTVARLFLSLSAL